MSRFTALLDKNKKATALHTQARILSYSILVAVIGFFAAATSYAQDDGNTVDYDIPASTLPQALRAFARQSRIELVFTEQGYEDVRTQPVIGVYQKERALEMLLAGTGLRVGFGSGDSVIVQRAQASEATTGFAIGGLDNGAVTLMAQTAVNAAQDSRTPGDVSQQGSDTTITGNSVDNSRVLEEIITTGSRIRGAQSASPIVTISREEIDMAGFATVEEVVEFLPQNFGAGATLDARTNATNQQQAVGGGDVGDFAGGTSVNLRGLGSDSTLVLLNGRRLSPSGFSASFTNIASIPVTAIERVEVMTDGASAIYGSDAIGGVINFILRDSFDGAETRLRYGSDASDGTSNVQFGQSFGTSWNSGDVLLSYEYYDSDPLASADRRFTASTDLSPFGGTDRRRPGGSPGNIVAGGQSFAIPTGQDGTSLTPADFVGLENTSRLYNSREFGDVIGAREQHSAFMHLRQTVGAVELFGAARFSNNEQSIRSGGGVVGFTVFGDNPATPEIEGNPWFVDPTGTGLTTVRVEYAVTEDFGPSVSLTELESAGATVGAQIEFGENWSAELAVNWSEEEGQLAFANQLDFAGLLGAVNLPDPNLAFNPFGDGPSTNASVIESLVNREREVASIDKNELISANIGVTGNAFDIAGGTVRVAAGIDFREESLFTGTFTTARELRTSNLERDILAVYGEVLLPLVVDRNRRGWLHRLEVSLAVRHEDYSDFGSSTDPKLGIVWSPTEALTFRGTIGTSFRAPSLTDLDDSTQSSWRYFPENFFGLTPISVLLQTGRNSDLKAQEATTWTTGFQWRPKSVDGFSLDVTYFNVDFKGRIEQPTGDAFGALSDPRFASVLTQNPSAEQIAAIVNHPNYDPDFLVRFGLGPFLPEDLISGSVPVAGIFDNRLTNLARSVVTGTEVQLSYGFDTNVGSFNLGFNGSYMFDFERRLLPTDPLFEEVDTFGRPVDFRWRGSFGWSRNRWSASGFVNYTDGYTDNVNSSVARDVDSWTTMDLTIAYRTGSRIGIFSDMRLALTTQNLFDEDPPFVDTIGGVAYDATNANPLGRFFSLQVTKDW